MLLGHLPEPLCDAVPELLAALPAEAAVRAWMDRAGRLLDLLMDGLRHRPA
ncbi:hypothetical protein [Micromonospora chersina]|uniref:hypothetical protein n=1 Tax=Micromonospora chersina TaxID=47854 RepID=UPI003711A8EB